MLSHSFGNGAGLLYGDDLLLWLRYISVPLADMSVIVAIPAAVILIIVVDVVVRARWRWKFFLRSRIARVLAGWCGFRVTRSVAWVSGSF